MPDTILLRSKKTLLLAVLSQILLACGTESDAEKADQVMIRGVDSPPLVSISQMSLIPTKSAILGRYPLLVTNHSNQSLKLMSYSINGARYSPTFLGVNGGVNRETAHNPPVNIIGCSILPAYSSCTISISPDAQDGSLALSLLYHDQLDKIYTAGQIVEYSSAIKEESSFIVSNKYINQINSTTPYTLSIPFMVNTDFKQIMVNSQIMSTESSNSCSSGATSGSNCSITLTLPAGPVSSYNNEIVISGITPDGKTKSVKLFSQHHYTSAAQLLIAGAPLIINEAKNFKGSLTLINIGNETAENIQQSLTHKSSLLNDTISNTTGYLDMTKCGQSILAKGDSCSVSFEINEKYATGFSEYAISYTDLSSHSKPTQATSLVYYLGKKIFEKNYMVIGDLDFRNVKVGASLSTSIRVKNIGKTGIKNLQLVSNLPANIELDQLNSNCLGYIDNLLAANQECNFSFKYAPTIATDEQQQKVEILATNEMGEVIKGLRQEINIKYSANSSKANGLVIDHAYRAYSIVADGNNMLKDQVQLQNVGDNVFTLKNIRASGKASQYLKISSDLVNSQLTSGQKSKIEYTYGPAPLGIEESGIISHTLQSRFSDNEKVEYLPILTTAYKSINSTVKVSGAVYHSDNSNDGNFPANPTNYLKDIPLVSKWIIRIYFKYEFTATTKNFRIAEDNLPFGISFSGYSTCPYKSTQAAKEYKQGEECLVVLNAFAFSATSDLYELALSNGQTYKINAPSYVLYDENKKQEGIKIIEPDVNVKFNLVPFAGVSLTKSNGLGQCPDNHECFNLIFKLDQLARTASLPIIIKPLFDASITPVSEDSCQISDKDGTCTIRFASDSKDINILLPTISFFDSTVGYGTFDYTRYIKWKAPNIDKIR